MYCYFRDPPAMDGLLVEDGLRFVSRSLDLENREDSLEIHYQKWCRQIEAIAGELKPDFFIIKSVMSKGVSDLFDSRVGILCPEALQVKSSPLVTRAAELAMTGRYADIAEIVDAMNREGFLKNTIPVEAIPIRMHEYLRTLCLRARNETSP